MTIKVKGEKKAPLTIFHFFLRFPSKKAPNPPKKLQYHLMSSKKSKEKSNYPLLGYSLLM